MNISDTTITYNGSNKTFYGSYLYGSGPADELVVSLGDYGSALMGFDIPIVNRPGPDFAIFENSFGDSFLELAFVEVSSDGVHFVRMPAVSLTQTDHQVNTFDTIDATKINNFAGKYRQAYGTPFDLEDIKDSAGVNPNKISHIRIIDAVGCLQDPFGTFDSQGHKVNEPWPTPFDTGGFDLDAVGVIHDQAESTGENSADSDIRVFPNPVVDAATFSSASFRSFQLTITDPAGKFILTHDCRGKTMIDLTSFHPGIYIATFTFQDETSVAKKIIKY